MLSLIFKIMPVLAIVLAFVIRNSYAEIPTEIQYKSLYNKEGISISFEIDTIINPETRKVFYQNILLNGPLGHMKFNNEEKWKELRREDRIKILGDWNLDTFEEMYTGSQEFYKSLNSENSSKSKKLSNRFLSHQGVLNSFKTKEFNELGTAHVLTIEKQESSPLIVKLNKLEKDIKEGLNVDLLKEFYIYENLIRLTEFGEDRLHLITHLEKIKGLIFKYDLLKNDVLPTVNAKDLDNISVLDKRIINLISIWGFSEVNKKRLIALYWLKCSLLASTEDSSAKIYSALTNSSSNLSYDKLFNIILEVFNTSELVRIVKNGNSEENSKTQLKDRVIQSNFLKIINAKDIEDSFNIIFR